MRILLVTEVIVPAGAETFVLRLADALQQQGHDVSLFCFYEQYSDKKISSSLAPEVAITWARPPWPTLLRKLDKAAFKLKIDVSLQRFFIRKALRKHMRAHDTEVVHSNLLKADIITSAVAESENIPIVGTIHGDYLQYYNKRTQRLRTDLLRYTRHADKNLSRLKNVICISDRQMQFFDQHFAKQTAGKCLKIYNGYTAQLPATIHDLRAELGIGTDDYVFGMVARGIAGKGWEFAIEAFLLLAAPDAHLILVGSGKFLNSIRQQYQGHKRIHFTGYSDAVLDWINIFNVAMLPSLIDSLPTVIIEYLYCGKPVIASDVGEIKNMLQTANAVAGVTIPIKNNKIPADELADAMLRYMTDDDYYKLHSNNAAICLKQFDMARCVNSYVDVYSEVIEKYPA